MRAPIPFVRGIANNCVAIRLGDLRLARSTSPANRTFHWQTLFPFASFDIIDPIWLQLCSINSGALFSALEIKCLAAEKWLFLSITSNCDRLMKETCLPRARGILRVNKCCVQATGLKPITRRTRLSSFQARRLQLIVRFISEHFWPHAWGA